MKPILLLLCLASFIVLAGCAAKENNEIQEPPGQEYYDMSTLAELGGFIRPECKV